MTTGAGDEVMRLTITTVAVIASLLLWTVSFYTAQKTYRVGQAQGVVPNLHIKERIGLRTAATEVPE